MKRIIKYIVIVIILINLCYSVNANSVSNIPEDCIYIKIDDKTYYDHGIPKEFNVAPYISSDNRTIVQINLFADALDAHLHWNENDLIKKIEKENRKVETIGELLNGYPIEGIPVIQKGYLCVPIRFIAEYFDYKVDWDGKTKTIKIIPFDFDKYINTIFTDLQNNFKGISYYIYYYGLLEYKSNETQISQKQFESLLRLLYGKLKLVPGANKPTLSPRGFYDPWEIDARHNFYSLYIYVQDKTCIYLKLEFSEDASYLWFFPHSTQCPMPVFKFALNSNDANKLLNWLYYMLPYKWK